MNVIQVVGRELNIPSNLVNIGVAGDNRSEIRIFNVPRYYSNGGTEAIDLAEYTPNLVVELVPPCPCTSDLSYSDFDYSDLSKEVNLGYKYPLVPQVSKDSIRVVWDITNECTTNTTKLECNLQFEKINLDTNEVLMWQTNKGVFTLYPTINTSKLIANTVPKDVITNHEVRIKSLEDRPAGGVYWNTRN